MTFAELRPIAVALALGLLVGLQREWKKSRVAGIRTFALIALTGAIVGLLVRDGTPGGGGLLVGLGMVSVALVVWIGNRQDVEEGEPHPGVTTEIAALVVYGCGVLPALGLEVAAIFVAGLTAALLHWKGTIHGAVHRMGERELRGIMQLVVLALVILPVLPDRTYGPYDVLNPFRIWALVVLIVGISLAAYVAQRMMRADKGAIVGGVLGGLISSTATTVSVARQANDDPSRVSYAALVVVIATAVVDVRVAVELAVAAPGLLRVAAVPLAVVLATMLLLSWMQLRRVGDAGGAPPETDNPAQIRAALTFGLLYAVILLIVAAARDALGEGALYGVAALSGLTDVDAITLSVAELHRAGSVASDVAWRAIVVAIASNVAFKWGALGVLGGRRLFREGWLGMGVSLIVLLVVAVLWPAAWTL